MPYSKHNCEFINLLNLKFHVELYNPCYPLRKKGSTSWTSLPVLTMVNALLVRQHNFILPLNRLHKGLRETAKGCFLWNKEAWNLGSLELPCKEDFNYKPRWAVILTWNTKWYVCWSSLYLSGVIFSSFFREWICSVIHTFLGICDIPMLKKEKKEYSY